MKKINKGKILRRFVRTIISILVFFILLIFSLRLPFVQNFIKDKASTYLEGKIKTKVSLEKIYIGIPK
ncbi:MAG: hypothetical protein KA232_05890, partial [Chryseobacterium sp.]|nr:hypothetical protein [Chryseobacterium sp.]